VNVFLRTIPVAFASIAVAVSTACTNSSSDGGMLCPAIALAPPFLLYPKPGATAVPTNVGIVIISNLVSPGTVTLTTTGSTVAAGSFGTAPSPLPSAAATPLGNPQAATIPTLFASSTYTVNYNATSTSGISCPPPQQSGALGTFST